MQELEAKTCTKCQQTKPIDEFNWKNKNDGKRHSRCRVCAGAACKERYRKTYQRDKRAIRQRNKAWYEANKERMAIYRKNHYAVNKEQVLRQTGEYKRKNRERVCQWARARRASNPEHHRAAERARYRANPNKHKAHARHYRERHVATLQEKRLAHFALNRDRLNEQASVRRRRRYREDPNYRIARSLRCRLRDAVKSQGVRKASKTLQLLGCTVPTLKTYIEAMFYDGMSWSMMGCRRNQWQLDHIVAVALFDLSDPEQQKACFHYTNLQPLWWADHQIKTQEDLSKIRLKHETASNNAGPIHLDKGSFQAP